VTTFFCDGLKEVTIVNGVARLEFQRLEVIERGGSRELHPVGEFTVALPLQGFIHALGVLDSVRERFVAQGLITPAGSHKGDDGPAAPPRSPNFS
jgi:hypothetical protein